MFHQCNIMASLLCTIILLGLSFVSGSEDVQLVRGVELKLQPFYNPNKDFTCLDGSSTIPFSNVNDDYCDCPDGTDEPGTAACPDGRYYCYNIGFKSQYIPSSRVNDGICDCCDGSDEYDSDVVCFNECQRLGEADKDKKREEMAETIEGAKLRSEYIQSGKDKKEEKQQRIETINSLLEQRRKELEAATAVKDEVEKPEKEAKDKHMKEWEAQKAKKKAEEDAVDRNSAFDVLDIDKDGWVSIMELASHKHLTNDLNEEEAKTLLGGETMVDREGMVNVWENIKPKFSNKERPGSSKFDESDREEDDGAPMSPPPVIKHTDYEKKDKEKLEGELKDLPPPPFEHQEKKDDKDELDKMYGDREDDDFHDDDEKDAHEEEHKEDEEDEDDKEGDKDDDDDDEDEDGVGKKENRGEKDEKMPEYGESIKQLIQVADTAREEFKNADNAVRQLENEKKDLEDYLGVDFGAHEEFSALKGECYDLTDREYLYKLCPFDKVTQRNKGGGAETNLGTKMIWVDKGTNRYTTMKYEGGTMCWNGPARSTTVYLSCGKENKLMDVNEPSRCEYEMHFKTPALCDEVVNHDEL